MVQRPAQNAAAGPFLFFQAFGTSSAFVGDYRVLGGARVSVETDQQATPDSYSLNPEQSRQNQSSEPDGYQIGEAEKFDAGGDSPCFRSSPPARSRRFKDIGLESKVTDSEPHEPESQSTCFASTAAQVLEWGFRTLPLQPQSKEPNFALLPKSDLGNATWEPYKHRSPDAKEALSWVSKDPQGNCAVVCGYTDRPDGLCLYVIDADSEDATLAVVEWLTETGLRTMVVRTSRGIHVYLLTAEAVPTGKVLIKGTVIEIKGLGAYVVAPGSIHPSGVTYEVLLIHGIFAQFDNPIEHFGGLVEVEAKEGNQSHEIEPSTGLRPKVELDSAAWDRILKRLRKLTYEKYDTNSEAALALAQICRNLGYEPEFYKAKALSHRQSTHIQSVKRKRGNEMALRAVDKCWNRTWAGHSPAALRTVKDLLRCKSIVLNRRWESKAGAGRQAALLAHIKRAIAKMGTTYFLSVRDGAELAHCHRSTFTRANRWLVEQGYVTVLTRASGEDANEYRINLDFFENETPTPIGVEDTWVSQSKKNLGDCGSGDPAEKEFDLSLRNPLVYGLFQRKALGKSAGMVWQALLDGAVTQKELRDRTGKAASTVSEALKKLVFHNMVSQDHNLFRAKDLSLDFVMALRVELEIDEMDRTRSVKHKREQEAHRMTQSVRRNWRRKSQK